MSGLLAQAQCCAALARPCRPTLPRTHGGSSLGVRSAHRQLRVRAGGLSGETGAEAAASGSDGSQFVIPNLSRGAKPAAQRSRVCRRCKGSRLVGCPCCKGTGALGEPTRLKIGSCLVGSGGYHSKNQVNLSKLIGSKWTTTERTLGYNYFTVAQKRKEGKVHYALLVAAGDTSQQLWINVKNLKDRGRWGAGWQRQVELQEQTGCECKACGGEGTAPCPLCAPRDPASVEIRV